MDLVISFKTNQYLYSCNFCYNSKLLNRINISEEQLSAQINYIFDYYSEKLNAFQRMTIRNEGSKVFIKAKQSRYAKPSIQSLNIVMNQVRKKGTVVYSDY